jgi:cobaltochelatase CobS
LYQSTGFRDRYEHGGVFLMDEIDASNPNILTVLNDALSNDSMSFPDSMVKRHPQFVAIAAANTWGNGATAEYVGRAPIDGATIDRFTMMHVKIDERLETELVRDTGLDMEHGSTWLNIVRTARRNVDANGLKVIVSPRASIGGAKLLAGGFTWQDVIDMRLLKGVKPDIVSKVMESIIIPKGSPVTV